MSIEGDFAPLRALQGKLKELGDPSSAGRRAVARAAAEAAMALVMKGFRESRDPYGKKWAPIKHRKGRPLLDTGRLRSSFFGLVQGDGFKLGTRVSYAGFHQNGTKRIKQRMMIPSGRVPPEWRKAIGNAMLSAVKAIIGRGRRRGPR